MAAEVRREGVIARPRPDPARRRASPRVRRRASSSPNRPPLEVATHDDAGERRSQRGEARAPWNRGFREEGGREVVQGRGHLDDARTGGDPIVAHRHHRVEPLRRRRAGPGHEPGRPCRRSAAELPGREGWSGVHRSRVRRATARRSPRRAAAASSRAWRGSSAGSRAWSFPPRASQSPPPTPAPGCACRPRRWSASRLGSSQVTALARASGALHSGRDQRLIGPETSITQITL